MLNQLQTLLPDLELPAAVWNEICWTGSLLGFADRVLFAGEKAVQLIPDPNYFDTRGLARALTGNISGLSRISRCWLIILRKPDKWRT